MNTCSRHAYRRASCAACQASNQSFDPSANLMLQALRRAYPERDDKDRPDWIADRIDASGTVFVRPMTFDDVAAWVERVSEGEVRADD